MDQSEIEKGYKKIIKSHPRSGAEWQRVKEITTKKDSNGSPYWDHVHSNQKKTRLGTGSAEGDTFDEPAAANADNRAYQQTGDLQAIMRDEENTREVVDRVRKLMIIAKQVLTEQQYNVFILLAVKEPHLTETETGKVLGITRGRVHQLWDAARKKLETAYDTRTA